jgi:glycosyltransferase involved in cell wall biosynthesis
VERAELAWARGGGRDVPRGPLKLIYLNPTGVLGGAEMCLLDLLASLRSARPAWSPRVLLGDDGPLRQEVEKLGVPCDVLPLPEKLARVGDAGLGLAPGANGGGRLALAARGPGAALAASRYLNQLRKRLRAERPDLIQTNGMKAHVLGAWAAPRGVPVVWHLHDYLGSRAVMARLLRWSRRPGLRGVAVSHSVAADAARVLGPRVPVEAVYNAVDLDRFAPGSGEGAWLDARAGLPLAAPGTIRVGLVATYARWKGHEVFLDAVARLAPARPARFFVVGGPIYKSAGSQYSLDELRAGAEARGLGDRVGFAGHQADPAAVYRALDVVVHASTRPEPFGRVIVEAMACGRAVVASSTGGAAELFTSGLSALGCPPGDPGALADALARLIADPDLRQALGAAGRETAVARFDRARLADTWGRIYDAACGNELVIPADRNGEGRPNVRTG